MEVIIFCVTMTSLFCFCIFTIGYCIGEKRGQNEMDLQKSETKRSHKEEKKGKAK